MQILITGGAGFIGSHLSERILSEGHSVVVIDDLSTGRIESISHLIGRDDFNFYEEEIGLHSRDKVQSLICDADLVFHLAASVGVKNVIENTARCIDNNFMSTKIVLDFAVAYKKPIIFISTSEVYGKKDYYLDNGSAEMDRLIMDCPITRRGAYACGKLLDEFAVLSRSQEIPVLILRPFNISGARQIYDYGMVIPSFVNSALHNMPLTVFGDGFSRRSFCHISDAVNIMVEMMNGLMKSPEIFANNIFNIGNSEEITINDLAHRVISRSGSSSDITYIPEEEVYDGKLGDFNRRLPCLDKLFSYIPAVEFKTIDFIIDDVLKFYREIT